ncbi:AAA family ATPase [Candidatus Woesearchaeota archaeon]|nr:AAA family ATPase [Candidatus Woesearchaeota archaeon]
MKLLIDKYKPKNLKDIKGLDREIKTIKEFIANFRKGKALLIFGPPGTGKTSSVHLLARELNYELFELNASNFRDKESIENILGGAIKQKSLFFKGKLILLDEIDGMSKDDRGGMTSLLKMIEDSSFPIIITSNEIEISSLESLIKKVRLLEYKKLNDDIVFFVLKDICEKEGIIYDIEILEKLAESCKGDLRAAIIDLQTLVINSKLEDFNVEDFNRLKTESITRVLNIIFSKNDINESKKHIELSDIDLVDISKRYISPVVFSNDNVLSYWLEENIPLQYNSKDIIKSFEILSRIDLLRSRIMRRQYWRYLAYINDLSAGISLNKSINLNLNHRRTKRSPKNNNKLWWLVSRKKKDIAEKISHKSHISMMNVMNNFYYYELMLRDEKLQDYFGLTQEEILWLEK